MSGYKGSWTRAALLPLVAITGLLCQQAVSAAAEKPTVKKPVATKVAPAKTAAAATTSAPVKAGTPAPVAAAPAVAGAPVKAADAEGIIFERQQIMKQIEEDADTLGSIVSGEIPQAKLVATTRSLAQGARQSMEAFKQNVPGGRSKPEVWSNNADYMQRMQSFVTNAEQLAKLAETGNMTAVTSIMGDALPCKQCHDVYREKKRS